MGLVVEALIESFPNWWCRKLWRVLLAGFLTMLPFLALAVWLWMSNSNLIIFAGPLACKIVGVMVGLLGAFVGLAVTVNLAEGSG